MRVGQWRPVKCLPATQKSFQFPTTALLDNYYWPVLCCAKLAGQQLWSYFFDVNSSPRQSSNSSSKEIVGKVFDDASFSELGTTRKKKLVQSQSRTLLCFCNLSLVSLTSSSVTEIEGLLEFQFCRRVGTPAGVIRYAAERPARESDASLKVK